MAVLAVCERCRGCRTLNPVSTAALGCPCLAVNFAHRFYMTVAGGPNGDKPITPLDVDTTNNSGVRWAAIDFAPSDVNTYGDD